MTEEWPACLQSYTALHDAHADKQTDHSGWPLSAKKMEISADFTGESTTVHKKSRNDQRKKYEVLTFVIVRLLK